MEKFNFTQEGINQMNNVLFNTMLELLIMNSSRKNEEISSALKEVLNEVVDAIAGDFDDIRKSDDFIKSVEEFHKELQDKN